MPKIELISFKLCPYVQRSVITLLEKNIPFDITYIELDNKPDWFLKISPLGKVPVLRINDDDILFESAVINEYLDEITPPSLHPEDPFAKARNRAWIEFGSSLLMTSHRLRTVEDEESLEKERSLLTTQLNQLEAQLKGGKFFNGERFSLVDTAYAPVFCLIDLLDRHFNTGLLEHLPRLKNWSDNLLQRPSVKGSVVEDYEERVLQRLQDSSAILTRQS